MFSTSAAVTKSSPRRSSDTAAGADLAMGAKSDPSWNVCKRTGQQAGQPACVRAEEKGWSEGAHHAQPGLVRQDKLHRALLDVGRHVAAGPSHWSAPRAPPACWGARRGDAHDGELLVLLHRQLGEVLQTGRMRGQRSGAASARAGDGLGLTRWKSRSDGSPYRPATTHEEKRQFCSCGGLGAAAGDGPPK